MCKTIGKLARKVQPNCDVAKSGVSKAPHKSLISDYTPAQALFSNPRYWLDYWLSCAPDGLEGITRCETNRGV
jgi:hypothetical protein